MRKVLLAVSAASIALGACTVAAPVETASAPPPPPPPAELGDPDPYYFNMVLPPKDASGTYVTPNTDIGPLETMFHFRSAMNVGALSCRSKPGMDMTDAYNAFIKKFKTTLANANKQVEAKFIRENARGKRARDRHMTSLYNHFARPATLDQFCPVAFEHLRAANELPTGVGALQDYSMIALAEIESIYQDHFDQVRDYQIAFRERMRENGQTPPPMPAAAAAPAAPA
ncbi:MAG: hypothetical protein WA906_12305, partial [Pacificimonas sp.]